MERCSILKGMFLISKTDKVQRKVPKAVRLEYFPCEDGLGELGWVMQEKGWLQGQLSPCLSTRGHQDGAGTLTGCGVRG